MDYSIELGPIRPPSEAFSILLRLTRNCPWNRCTFCPTFKGQKFSMRTVEEVRHDIDSIRFILERVSEKVEKSGVVKRQVISEVAEENGIEVQYVEQVVHWIHCG